MYEFDWSSIMPYMLQGMAITLKITVTAVIFGIVWGIVLFQDTSLVYVLNLADFFRTASSIGERDGTQVEMLLFAGLVYFVISLSASTMVNI